MDTDVVVVGAGAAGAAAAWALSERGVRVEVVERFSPGHERGSSHGTERIFRYGYADAVYVRLAAEARAGWRRLEEQVARPLLQVTGGFDMGFPDELEAIAVACRAEGIDSSLLSPADATARAPGIVPGGEVLWQDDAGVLAADVALAALVGRAEERGARVRFEEPVRRIDVDADEVVVTTDDRAITAEVVVVGAGAWSAPVLAGLVDLPPIVVTQEQVAYFRPRHEGPWPIFIDRSDTAVYGQPTPSGLVKVGEHATGPVVDPDDRPDGVERVTWQRLLAWVGERLPGVDPEPVGSRTCLYATGPGEAFVLDRVGRVVVAAGLAGHGFKFTPAIGERLAALACGDSGPNPFTLAAAPGGIGRSGHR